MVASTPIKPALVQAVPGLNSGTRRHDAPVDCQLFLLGFESSVGIWAQIHSELDNLPQISVAGHAGSCGRPIHCEVQTSHAGIST